MQKPFRFDIDQKFSFRKKSSFPIQKISYDDRLNLIGLKDKIAEKVFRDLSRQYHNFKKEKTLIFII